MKKRVFRQVICTLLAVIAVALSWIEVCAQKYTGSPVTKERLVRAVRSRQFAVPVLVKQIKISGVDFELTPAIEGELAAAGAHSQVVEAVRISYRYAGQARGRQVPAPDAKGERYEQLYYQGLDALQRLRTATTIQEAGSIARSVIALAQQAINADPSRHEAYTLVGSAHLLTRNMSEAERYGQMAIDRGGSLAFPVYHLAGMPHIETLYIGLGFATIESNQKFFQFTAAEVTGPQRQNNYMMSGIMVAVFSINTFKEGRRDIWYFAPANTGTAEEADMIIRLVRKNCSTSVLK